MPDTTEAPADPRSHALFDEHGRCIPGALKSEAFKSNRRRFVCPQPVLDYPGIHARIKRHLVHDAVLSASDFQSRAEAVLSRLEQDEATRHLARGVAVPFFLPKEVIGEDIGQILDERYLPALKASFEESFPDYTFTNHDKVGCSGRLSVATESRHAELLVAMRDAEQVGIYFPCLPGYSIPAAREQMAYLPKTLGLAGGFDTFAAFIGSPDLLLRRDGYPPLLWLAALDDTDPGAGYHLEAYGYNLTFNRRIHLGQAAEYWSSGLVVLA